jgi:hypothetical protein
VVGVDAVQVSVVDVVDVVGVRDGRRGRSRHRAGGRGCRAGCGSTRSLRCSPFVNQVVSCSAV